MKAVSSAYYVPLYMYLTVCFSVFFKTSTNSAEKNSLAISERDRELINEA